MTARELRAEISQRAMAAQPGRLMRLGAIFAAVGLAAFIFALFGMTERAWHAYHLNFVMFTLFAQASIVFAATQKITKGKWAGFMIRFSEAAVAFLPVSLVLYLVLFLGRTHIFTWIHDPRPDLGPWLTTSWVFIRDFIVLSFLTWLSIRFVRADLRPDLFELRPQAHERQRPWFDWVLKGWSEDEPSVERNRQRIYRMGPGIAIAYAFGYSFVGTDLVMSLSPHWFSNLYPGFFFMGGFLSALAGLALLTLYWRKHLGLEQLISKKQLHDLGKITFGFTVFWAYLMFAQFLVIWYGNLPEETWFVFYRLWGVWRPVATIVFLMVFLIPFIGLLGVRPKTMPLTLGLFTTISVLGLWLEKYLLIVPSVNEGGGPAIGIPELGITIGFLGVFLLSYGWFAKTFPMLSPRLAAETLESEH